MITSENGSPVAETGRAAAHAASILRYTAAMAGDLDAADVRPFPVGGAETVVRRQPVGVAALIAPRNFPLTLIMVKLAPALLAGCAVVIKPALKPRRFSCLTAAAYGAGATVARTVVCSWRSTCDLREPPPGSPQTMVTSVPGWAAEASSIARESNSPSLLV